MNGTQQKPNLKNGGHKILGKLKLSESHYKLCLRVELVVLCVLIAVIWALLAIPIFMFHLSEVRNTTIANTAASFERLTFNELIS